MKKFMLGAILGGDQTTEYYDEVDLALHDAYVIGVSLKGFAEVYRREPNNPYSGYIRIYYCGKEEDNKQ